MTELWLKFRDEKGEDQKVLVEGEKFIIGRHSECNWALPSGKLSRQHAKIERFADVYVVSDCDSSNGTFLNGEKLSAPVALKDGDTLDLGGDLETIIELINNNPKARNSRASGDDDEDFGENGSSAGSGGYSAAGGRGGLTASGETAFPTSILWLAPVFGLIILLCAGGFFFGLGGNDNREIVNRTDGINYSSSPEDTLEKDPTPTPKPSETTGGISSGETATPTPDDSKTSPTPVISANKKLEQDINSFLPRIAKNDPNAFLSGPQVELISSRITQFSGSSALAENLKAVKQNASEFIALANSKDLKPQFLAVAALTKIGNNKDNPLEVAKKILPVLNGLKISLANNLADDNLLIIAAYDQGEAGKFKDLRNSMEGLAMKNKGVTPQEIRTIWFLKKAGKITDSEFEFALRFLAIGAITQNPKDFNVNAEAAIFD